jgi:branched-chain amino acid aminotransferase
MVRYAWLNGELVDIDKARVTPFDAGFQHGVGLFETLRAYDGVPFLLTAHLIRLQLSAQQLGILPGDRTADIRHAVHEVLEANELTDARIRITVTAGPLGQSPDEQPKPTVLVVATDKPDYPAELYKAGMTVTWSPFRQSADDPLAGHKTTCYFARLLALRQAQARNGQEAIWLNRDGKLAEGCTCNLFLARDGVLKTPPRSTPVLPGVTRAVVIELAKTQNVPVEEMELDQGELLAADEAFLTNAVMGVMPLCRVERQAIGAGMPGDLTRQIYEGYHQFIRQETTGE